MSTQTEKGEWTKELGGIWFLCLFAGFIMGGVVLIYTIPIAIVSTIYPFFVEIIGEKCRPMQSTRYQS
jgi:hypothetical protein